MLKTVQAMLGGLLLSLALAAGYVAPLHLVPGSRDDSRTIRARMACILGCSCLSWIPIVVYVKPQVCSLRVHSNGVRGCMEQRTTQKTLMPCRLASDLGLLQGPGDLRQMLGLAGGQQGVVMACFAPLATTAVLFLGPLTMELYDSGKGKLRQRYSVPLWRSAAAWRDLVVGPLSEEFIFRVLLLLVLRKAVSLQALLVSCLT